jgi:hypothetical protein
MLHCVRELLVHVLGEGLARVIGQYPDEHDGIVLDMRAVIVLLGEELANLLGGCRCSSWACDGGLDNRGEVQHFFALVAVSERSSA